MEHSPSKVWKYDNVEDTWSKLTFFGVKVWLAAGLAVLKISMTSSIFWSPLSSKISKMHGVSSISTDKLELLLTSEKNGLSFRFVD